MNDKVIVTVQDEKQILHANAVEKLFKVVGV